MGLKELRRTDAAFDFACFVIDKLREQGLTKTATCVKCWFEQYDQARQHASVKETR